MPFLRKLFGAAPAATALPPLPAPAVPVCVIGDLHGRADLLEAMLARIAAEPGAAAARLVVVGDMIDRGPGSAAVLERLRALTEAQPGRVTCLMGNHERMLLEFLADPARNGGRWLGHGGAETLASFGLRGRAAGTTPAARFQGLAEGLRAAMPAGLEAWLGSLPLLWQEGALAVTHAGADPARPLDRQTETALLWGHPDFTRKPRGDGVWLAHGHVIHPAAVAQAGRIAVDTGAWRSGLLSAAWCDARGLRFLACGPEGDSPADPALPAAP